MSDPTENTMAAAARVPITFGALKPGDLFRTHKTSCTIWRKNEDLGTASPLHRSECPESIFYSNETVWVDNTAS